MIILPAIDILEGKPVRLYQGDYGQKSVVADSVEKTAMAFKAAGAERIHMVDLDGAREGHLVNHELIAHTAESVRLPVEAGGGIRTMEDVEWYLKHNIDTVILGTAAIQNPAFVKEALRRFPHHIAIGLDCRNGYAMISGWQEGSQKYYLDFARQLAAEGAESIIYTDISRDGTLQGPSFEQLKALQQAVPQIKLTASGGIHNIDDIRRLNTMGVYGAITGQAIYSGQLNLADAIALTREKV